MLQSLRQRCRILSSWSSHPRRADLARVSDTDMAALLALCPASSTDVTTLAAANVDWMGKYHGHSPIVVLPTCTDELARALAYCNKRRLAVVPQGGNTGLVGGATPVHDEVVINLRRMNDEVDIDEDQGVVVCEAGCVLQELDDRLAKVNLIMPLDLGAKGSCHIGGNVATNAGGIRLLRYGSMHANVVGLEWVTADGTVVNSLSKLRKDNTGFDLKQLMIGSEGALGIITKVALLAHARPTTRNLAFVGVDSFQKVLDTMRCARQYLGEILSAVEFQDRLSLEMVLRHGHQVKDPMPGKQHPFYMVIESMGFSPQNDSDRMLAFLEEAMTMNYVADGILAQDSHQIESLWSLRELIAESLCRAGVVYKYDVSIPVAAMYDLVQEVRARSSFLVCCGYGHLGDSNLHLNVVVEEYSDRFQALLEPFVYEAVQRLNGSISAEHGLGLMKAKHMSYSKSPVEIAMMRQLKDEFDPKGILNPYKVLPPTSPATGSPSGS